MANEAARTSISFLYGHRQQFKNRYRDVTIPGNVQAAAPLRSCSYRLNDGAAMPLYVEDVSSEGVDWRFQYKNSPSRLRLKNRGDFNVEIPVEGSELQEGTNRLVVEVEDTTGRRETGEVTFTWDPAPPRLLLDLADLSSTSSIQEIGQVVNGAFEVDAGRNAIRTRAPVAPDALLILGPSWGSQEATYDVVFSDLMAGKYLGLSDFFVGHEPEEPPIGIKPGWSTAGLATLTYGWRPGSPPDVRAPEPGRPIESLAGEHPQGEARVWLASGDNTRRGERWVVKSDPPARLPIEAGARYRVRHQVLFEGGVNRARFKLWPVDQSEPAGWLCDEDDSAVPSGFPRFDRASFALFQHTGSATEWSNIRVRPIEEA